MSLATFASTSTSIITATGPSCGDGTCINLWDAPLTGAGSKSSSRVKSIESQTCASSEASCNPQAAISVAFTPHIDTDDPQTIPPSASAPCAAMMIVAFIRPRAQPGIARCPATQSSEAAIVHAVPAKPQRQETAGWIELCPSEKTQ